MRIGLDFDGVVANCGKMKAGAAKKLYGLNISPNDFDKDFVLGRGYLTPSQYRQFKIRIYETREFAFLLEPVEGLMEYLPRLLADGHVVSVITSRYGFGFVLAEEWFARLGMPVQLVSVGYGNSKAEAALGLEVFIDDTPKKLVELVGVVPHRFLFSWGYNEGFEVGTVARRVASWREFYEAIGLLKNAL